MDDLKNTAIKLADELNLASSEMEYNYVVQDWKLLSDSADMIRKLVEELDNQEKEIQNMAMDELVRISQEWGGYGDKQDKPVAFLKNGNVKWVQYPMDMSKPIPLYTTPQTKPLNEETLQAMLEARNGDTTKHNSIDELMNDLNNQTKLSDTEINLPVKTYTGGKPHYVQPRYAELTDDEIISYASKAGLLNYVDNETPRRYWIDDRNEVEDFVAFVQDMIKKAGEKCGATES